MQKRSRHWQVVGAVRRLLCGVDHTRDAHHQRRWRSRQRQRQQGVEAIAIAAHFRRGALGCASAGDAVAVTRCHGGYACCVRRGPCGGKADEILKFRFSVCATQHNAVELSVCENVFPRTSAAKRRAGRAREAREVENSEEFSSSLRWTRLRLALRSVRRASGQ